MNNFNDRGAWPFPRSKRNEELSTDEAKVRYVDFDFIGVINRWNLDAGRSNDHFNARNIALYTGLQCEELAEKLEACGLAGAAHSLALIADELKQGFWDKVIATEGKRKEMLDADADLVVVTVGSAQAQGADFKMAMKRVVGANENKRFPDGTLHKDGNGKTVKPEGWTPPDLSDCISSN